MTLAQLRASLKLWQGRLAYRKGKHAYWTRRERRAKASAAKERAHAARRKWTKNVVEAERLVAHRKQQIAARKNDDGKWAGSRYYTNQAIRIVNGRAPVTSRKRSALFGNPGSDHHIANRTADAVDFGTVENHALKNELSRKLGGPSQLEDYGVFTTQRNGHTYRHQLIAGTHGTGPHLHYGVKRVA